MRFRIQNPVQGETDKIKVLAKGVCLNGRVLYDKLILMTVYATKNDVMQIKTIAPHQKHLSINIINYEISEYSAEMPGVICLNDIAELEL